MLSNIKIAHVQDVKVAMLKYVKKEVRPSCKLSILSQQDIKAAQNLIADAVNTAAKKSYLQ